MAASVPGDSSYTSLPAKNISMLLSNSSLHQKATHLEPTGGSRVSRARTSAHNSVSAVDATIRWCFIVTNLCDGVQAHNTELASPLTVSASYARSQSAAIPQQASVFGGKSSKMATFTSATLSRAATLKNKVLAPTAAAPAIQPGQESLPANRGKNLQPVACSTMLFVQLVVCFALVCKLTYLTLLHLPVVWLLGHTATLCF